MKKIGRWAVVVVGCLALAAPAWAAWTVTKIGAARAISDASCVQDTINHMVCAVMSEKSAMMVDVFNGTGWSGWKSLAGVIVSKPSCSSAGSGLVVCAATASSGGMEYATYNLKTWSTPKTISGTLYSGPSCAPTNGGAVCVARSSVGGLTWATWNGSAWSAFKTLATKAISAPSCVAAGTGDVICAFFTSESATLVNAFTGTGWRGFLNLGGSGEGDPSCSVTVGRIVCVEKSFDAGIMANFYTEPNWVLSSWGGYQDLGGSEAQNAGCAADETGGVLVHICGVIGIVDNAFYRSVWEGTWSPWVFVGGIGAGIPDCEPLGTGQVLCVMRNIDNTLSSVIGP